MVATETCSHCNGDNLAVFQNTSSCPGLASADYTCKPIEGVNCCLDAGSEAVCAGSFCKEGFLRAGCFIAFLPC